MPEVVDLHTHTTHSDGVFTPAELLKKANELGLKVLGITDHDTVNGIEESIEIGRGLGVEVVPGVELSATIEDREIHILGYFIDYRNPNLLEYLSTFRKERIRRAERIVKKLNIMNVPLKFQTVLEKAGDGSVGRPHIAHALVEEGLIETYDEAFAKYIGNGRPAYEKKILFSPEEAIALIASAGGLSFLAHPGKSLSDVVLLRLIKSGLDGIEVIHPSHTPEQVSHYRKIATQYFLLESGGSDFHGGDRNDNGALGSYNVPIGWVEAMKRRLA